MTHHRAAAKTLGQASARLVHTAQQHTSRRHPAIIERAPLGRNIARQEGQNVTPKLVTAQIPRSAMETSPSQMRQQRRGKGRRRRSRAPHRVANPNNSRRQATASQRQRSRSGLSNHGSTLCAPREQRFARPPNRWAPRWSPAKASTAAANDYLTRAYSRPSRGALVEPA